MLRAVNTDIGKIIVSIILGVGLASIFRKVCNSRDCLVFHGPPIDEVVSTTYKHGGKCYQFKESSAPCDSRKKTVDFA